MGFKKKKKRKNKLLFDQCLSDLAGSSTEGLPNNQPLPRCNMSTIARFYNIRVFAIYQILLGWKRCKYYCETDELPNPRPIQPKKK